MGVTMSRTNAVLAVVSGFLIAAGCEYSGGFVGGQGGDRPTTAVSPASLNFAAVAGGTEPASKTVTVSNTGAGTLSWTLSITYTGTPPVQ